LAVRVRPGEPIFLAEAVLLFRFQIAGIKTSGRGRWNRPGKPVFQKGPDRDKYDELSYYTLSHSDPSFIHQHIVDAFTAQTAEEKIKPIAITFALIGLYLHIEKRFTGRQVQLAHMRMGRDKKPWPHVRLPKNRGEITVSDVLLAPAGKARDEMIHKWCRSVWSAYEENHRAIGDLWKTYDKT
jgi:hypothetical protein